MIILGIESAAHTASAALVSEDLVLAEYTIDGKLTHSQTLLPMIDEIVRRSQTEISAIDAAAVSAGPGSFTGLRIGTGTAKGLGLALDIPLIAVPTTDAMAYGFYGCRHLICPIMDARRDQVYTGIYDYREEFTVLQEAEAVSVDELAGQLSQWEDTVLFLGDGVPRFGSVLREKLGARACFAPAGMNRARAALVASYGAKLLAEHRETEPDLLLPVYLRESQAERVRRERIYNSSPSRKKGAGE